jgi:guanosine-3',5'-bis(diphosphate) 3'-pyrophosphohydrolase
MLTDCSLLTYAKFYATVAHKDQRYGILPYTHHLQDVQRVIDRFHKRMEARVMHYLEAEYESLRIAAWLHDILENTPTKYRDLEENFGVHIAGLVEAVTTVDAPTRNYRMYLTLHNIRKAGKLATRLKLADRIANMENQGASLGLYQREYDQFRLYLYDEKDLLNKDMWEHLSALAAGEFPCL